MAFSVMLTIAMDKDDDFCDNTYDVAPESLSLWQRLSAIKVELELELQGFLFLLQQNTILKMRPDWVRDLHFTTLYFSCVLIAVSVTFAKKIQTVDLYDHSNL